MGYPLSLRVVLPVAALVAALAASAPCAMLKLPDAYFYAGVDCPFANPIQKFYGDAKPVDAANAGTYTTQIGIPPNVEYIHSHFAGFATTRPGLKHRATVNASGTNITRGWCRCRASITYPYGLIPLGFAPADHTVKYKIRIVGNGTVANARNSGGGVGNIDANIYVGHKPYPHLSSYEHIASASDGLLNTTGTRTFSLDETHEFEMQVGYYRTIYMLASGDMAPESIHNGMTSGSFFATVDPIFEIDPDDRFYYQGRWYRSADYYQWVFGPGLIPGPATLGLLTVGSGILLARRDRRRRRTRGGRHGSAPGLRRDGS